MPRSSPRTILHLPLRDPRVRPSDGILGSIPRQWPLTQSPDSKRTSRSAMNQIQEFHQRGNRHRLRGRRSKQTDSHYRVSSIRFHPRFPHASACDLHVHVSRSKLGSTAGPADLAGPPIEHKPGPQRTSPPRRTHYSSPVPRPLVTVHELIGPHFSPRGSHVVDTARVTRQQFLFGNHLIWDLDPRPLCRCDTMVTIQDVQLIVMLRHLDRITLPASFLHGSRQVIHVPLRRVTGQRLGPLEAEGIGRSTVMYEYRCLARQHIVRVLRSPSPPAFSQVIGGFLLRCRP